MKNLLLFSTLFLTATVSLAQLTVKPTSGGADSYIYVNDQVLFVNQDINLTRNDGSPITEANIYLRNNGQLIQGDAGSDNSGSGQVSVQQNAPDTQAWAYYYWCSPIGSPGPTTGPRPAGNQYFGVSQIFEPIGVNTTTAVRSSTTSAQNGTVEPMTISTRWLYTHVNPGTEAEGDYQRMNGGNNAPPGFGFTMKGVGGMPAHDQMYEFRGRPNNGDFTIPVAGPVSGEGQMTLSGNPYPSALDLNKLFYDLPDNNELGTFWYYDEDRTVATHYYSNKPYGYGAYIVGDPDIDNDPYDGDNLGSYTAAPFYIWNSGGGHGGSVGTSSNDDENKRFAPIGQGIMFVGDADGDVIIKNSHRIFFREGDLGSIFQRPITSNNDTTTGDENSLDRSATTATAAIPDYRDPQMRIWTIFDEAVTRDMLIVFYDQATDGYDRGLDGLSPMGMHTDAYFPIGNDNNRKPYVINGIQYDYGKQIPIAFKLKNQTKFEVKAVEEVKKPYDQAYIFDREQQTYQQITGGEGATFNLPAGKYDNRFFVVFRSPNVKRDAPVTQVEAKTEVMAKVDFFQNNPLKQLEIQNPEGYTLKSASVYDMNGKLVINEKNLGDNTHYSFYTGNLSDGVYLVKLTTSEDITIDYKAIVHNK